VTGREPRVARARRWPVLVLPAAALVAVGFQAVHRQVRDGNDFPIYWQAARDLLSGRSPYDVASGLHGYVYLPWFAWALSPLALLPLRAAAWCWYAANLLFLWHAALLTLAALRAAGLAPRGRALLLAALPLAGLAHDNLVLGQANPLLLWLCALAVRGALADPAPPGARARRGPAWLRQAALGLAMALKMSAAMLAPPLVLRGARRSLAAIAAGAALATLAPLALSGAGPGLRHLAEWREKVVAPAAAGTLQGSRVIDQSPHAGLRRLLVAEPAFGETRVNVAALAPAAFAKVSRAVAVALVLAYALIWLSAPARGSPLSLLLDLALGCCAMVQVTGFHLKAQFVVLLPAAWAAATLAFAPGGPRDARALLLAAGALFLFSQPGLVGRAGSDRLLAYSSMGAGTLLLAAALVALRYRVTATPSPSAARSAAPGTGTAP